MNNAYKAYKEICNALGIASVGETEFKKLCPKSIDGTVLVPVPNITLTHEQLYKLAEDFGSTQP